MNEGRCPREVSAWRVNWLTTRAAPPIARKVAVHAAVLVREDPERRDPAGEPVGGGPVVVRRDREQDAEPGADRADGLS